MRDKREKRCIFCGRPGKMTAEHFWGEWTKNYIPRRSNKHTAAEVFVPKPGQPDPALVRTRAGHPLDANAAIVCGKCNSGWLSGIQDRAKAYLVPLAAGKHCALDPAAQSAIATWITMACMTAEHSNRLNNVGVPQSERDRFMNQLSPPPTWKIWIGWCFEPKQMQWVHTAFHILDNDAPSRSTRERLIPNGQFTAFVFGQLYFYALSGPYVEFAKGWDWRTAPRARSCLIELWPQKSASVDWPPRLLMTEDDVVSFAGALPLYFDSLFNSHSTA